MECAEIFYGSDDARQLLNRNGLTDLATIIERATRHGQQRHTDRSIWETELTHSDGTAERVFIKIQVDRTSWRSRIRELFQGRTTTFPEREWNGLKLLKQAGLNVPSPLALMFEGESQRAAIVIKAVPPAEPIGRMIRGPHWRSLTRDARAELLNEVVRSVDTIHQTGHGWRGASAKHVYPERQSEQWNVWLIDCEGVHGSANRKTIRRDYGRLYESLVKAGLDGPELDIFRQRIRR